MQTKTKFVLLIIFILTLAACGGAGQDTSLEGTAWELIFIENGSLVSGANVTINFQDSQVSGIAACNNYGGDYIYTSDGAFFVEAMFMTEMYCQEEARNQLERDYLQALGGVTSAKVQGDELILIGAYGQMVFGLISQ